MCFWQRILCQRSNFPHPVYPVFSTGFRKSRLVISHGMYRDRAAIAEKLTIEKLSKAKLRFFLGFVLVSKFAQPIFILILFIELYQWVLQCGECAQ